MKKFVVFYSRAKENYFAGSLKNIEVGNTEKIADYIIEITGADKFKIEQEIPYADDYNTCLNQTKKDLTSKARPKVMNMPKNIEEYDEIYLGYPNYWGTMPMAVYTFLEAYDFRGKTIYPFCTHEGSGLSSTERDIKNVAKGALVKEGLAIVGSRVDSAKRKVEEWI